MASLYALVVAIDKYPTPAFELYGCRNDADAFAEYLAAYAVGAGTTLQLKTLFDANARRDAVIDGFRTHLAQAGPGDTALFYFAGHGSQEPAPPEFWDVEPDRLNETLVCWDSRQPDQWDLADKELSALLSAIAERGPHLTVILDCCHSGSGTRGGDEGVRERRIPASTRPRPLDSLLLAAQTIPPQASARAVSGWQGVSGARHVLMAACQDHETAKEYFAGDRRHGVFTHFLLDTLARANDPLTYGELHARVGVQVSSRFMTQAPQLEAKVPADLTLPFLGLRGESRPNVHTASHRPDGSWILDAGRIHGIAEPRDNEAVELALFPLDATTGAMRRLPDALTSARVVEVLAGRSRLDVASPERLEENRSYKAVVTASPLPPLRIRLEGDADGLALLRQAIATASLDGSPSLYVTEAESSDVCRVIAKNGEYAITSASSDRPLTAQVKPYSIDSARQAVDMLEHIARWVATANLPSNLVALAESDLEITVLRSRDPDVAIDPTELRLEYTQRAAKWLRPGVWIKVTNRSERTLYCALFALTELFGISSDMLSSGTRQLEKGQTFWALDGKPVYFTVPPELRAQGTNQARDVLKLIASTAPFEARLLEQEELEGPRVRSAPSTSGAPVARGKGTLERLLARVQTRGVSSSASDEDDLETIDEVITKALHVTTVGPREATTLAEGREADLGFGVRILPHSTFVAAARLTSLPQVDRDLGTHVLPPIFRDDRVTRDGVPPPETLHFTQGRSTDPGLSILEFAPAAGAPLKPEAVSPEAPLRLQIQIPLGTGEQVLPIAYDPETHCYLPLGRSTAGGAVTSVTIERLPAPMADQERSLTGSIRILFQKLVAKPLGFGYEYPILTAVEFEADGSVTYVRDEAIIRARVAAASRIIVVVHGIIGDTTGMPGCLRPVPAGTVILAFDYENLHTTIGETAKTLGDRLTRAGLTAGHGKQVQLVCHSRGGLVARALVEQHDGRKVISHVVMLGTPNAGSPWARIEDWITFSVALVINGLTTVTWPVAAVGWLLGTVEKIDGTLDEMHPRSRFLTALAETADPRVPYTVIAGDTSLMDATRAATIKRLMNRLLSVAFLNMPNDIAASVDSIMAVPGGRVPAASVNRVACDHLSYFKDDATVHVLRQALGL